ncbi:hypothetical protein CRM22_009367, partial [Opisthorchis felineus]
FMGIADHKEHDSLAASDGTQAASLVMRTKLPTTISTSQACNKRTLNECTKTCRK